MKLKSLHKILFVFCFFSLFFNDALIAQPPCVFPPPIYSEVVQGVASTRTTVLCPNTPLTLSSTSLTDCPSCTYQWSDGATGPFTFAFSPGLYSVTVTDNAVGGCVGISTTLNITASSLQTPLIDGTIHNICTVLPSDVSYAYLNVSNPCPTCTYQWFDSLGNNLTVPTIGDTSYTALSPGGYYVQVAYPVNLDSFCTKNSAMISVGSVIISNPILTASATEICDSNDIVLNTIDCNGCEYDWYFYDFPDTERLIITGVYDGPLTGGEPKGIELYAVGNIPDLSEYGLILVNNPVPGPAGTFSTQVNFPSMSVFAGTYIYVAHNAALFSQFFNFPANHVIASVTNLDGTDRVELLHNSSIVDAFGDFSGSTGWHHTDGWTYRADNQVPNGGTFNVANWTIQPGAFIGCDTNATCGTPFPLQNFTTTAVGTVPQLITGADTSTWTTNTTGYYTVEVTYPNACSRESNNILIDTSIFDPKIYSIMPGLIDTGDAIYNSDTAYLCKGSYVDLRSLNPFLAPPSWGFQWFKNGNPIPGATGYNYRTDSAGIFCVEVTNSAGCISMSNCITVLKSIKGANPSITASSFFLCSSADTSRLSTPGCTNCSYQWYTEDGFPVTAGTSTNNYYTIDNISAGLGARGYYVLVTDDGSGCAYSSNILEIKDTVYQSPVLTTGGNTVCSTTPIDLSTTPCAFCSFIWMVDSAGTFVTKDSTQQFTYQIDTAGKYRVEILYENGCRTNFSNTIQATFETVNANIATPPLTSICNGENVIISALPDTAACPDCSYVFLRDGVPMQLTQPPHQQEISLAGDYQVVVTNDENCGDTSAIVTFTEVSLSTSISQSTGVICGPTSCVDLVIDSCVDCSYQWFFEGNSVIAYQDSLVYTACGYASAGTYEARVSKLGCVVSDSVELTTVPQLTITIEIDSSASTSPTICNGSSVFLLDICTPCIDSNYYQYLWHFNGNQISGASFESYQVDTPGTYYVEIVDGNNCYATSNQIFVQEFYPDASFALDFTPLDPAIPITYGTVDMDNYLTPASLHPVGAYTSLTAGGAISGDFLDVGAAGSGFHIITYTYTQSNAQGSCTFSTFDTIQVLGAMDMAVDNMNPNAPPFEACLFDTLIITVTNFTFIPTEVVFVAGGGATISVAVTPTLTTVVPGVYSGSFNVVVPDGARTGKLTLTDGGANSFQSGNFFVVQNPAVTIDLLGTMQPVCSNLDTAVFSGLPAGGVFSVHYINQPDSATLIAGNVLQLENITGYSNGFRNVMMMYTYTPTYTGTSIACPQSVQDSLLVEVRDAELDEVFYTPIAYSQNSESVDTLTLITNPVSARNYNHSITGTYVIANTLLPSSIDTSGGYDGYETVTYEINNGGCVNSSVDSVNVWPTPGILDAIPRFLCSKDDTVFIQRSVDSLWVTYRGQVIYSDTLYKYSAASNVAIGTEVRYDEKVNLMEITSSNGGLDSINFLPPNELYYFVPGDVVGNSTTVRFKFKYWRKSTFFDDMGNITGLETTNYVIAEVAKTFLIEDPSVVAINPVILADTIFCPIDQNYQFLGQPAGGQYYLDAMPGYNTLSGNIFNPIDWPTGQVYGLTYVYTGQACIDSAYTDIYIPDSFNIRVAPNNGTGEYCETSPNDSIFFQLLPPNLLHQVDTSSAQFFIGGIQSSTIFSPTQVGPPGDYYVKYVVNDIDGCPAEALDTFTVFPIPVLATSPLSSTYCLNDDSTEIHLYVDTSSTGTFIELTYGGGYLAGDLVTLLGPDSTLAGTGLGNAGINPNNPFFFPAWAGVGVHGISYVYTDANSCSDSINLTVQVFDLPNVYMVTTGGAAIEPYYCENDSIPLFGFPIGAISGYGSDTSALYGNPMVNNPGPGGVPSSFDSSSITFEPYIAGPQPGILTEYLFYYYQDNNGCRDTMRYPVTIRNFTTDPEIVGLPDTICASDMEIYIEADSSTAMWPNGMWIDSLGWFESPFINAFSMLGASDSTSSTYFYPDSAGVVFANRNVDVTFYYQDTARQCLNSISDTCYVRALPYLSLSESLATSLSTINPPGSKLIAPATDTFYHICETEPEIPLFVMLTKGQYDPFGDSIIFGASTHITPDIGNYVGINLGPGTVGTMDDLSDGVKWNGDPVNRAYGYISAQAGFGIDTIRYSYTDIYGCTDSIDHIIFIDSLPLLTFAGLGNYDAATNRYVYCETEPNPPIILPAPIGVDWTLTFDNQPITSIPFQLRPDTLAVPGVIVDYPLYYYYVGQKYASGLVCSDSLLDTIEIRPAPQLSWVNVPDSYCMLDSFERLPLSATPYGGAFFDLTPGLNGIPGIVADSLFVPDAQPGRRQIVYQYLDPATGCEDTIQHIIYVYSKPRINFDILGGCSGTQVDFIATTAPYGMEYDSFGVAIDSITRVIWNYGDGVIDTFAYLPDTLVIPTTSHTYAGSGVFYPSLTVENRGICDTTFTRRIVISPLATPTAALPYIEDFEAGTGGWIQEAADTSSQNGIIIDSLWQWGVAIGTNINTSQAANHIWGTRLEHVPTTYRQGENAWVYSPCFDMTNLDRPMISLNIWRNAQNHVDGAVIQYHDDVSNSWKVLGETAKGVNWYQSGFVVSSPGFQTNTPTGWTGTSSGWEKAKYRLDNIDADLRFRTNVRFRIAFASSPNTLLGINDGFAFDSVKIGNRTRNVLTEHFSGVGYPGIEYIEDQLYNTIYSNLYGRDVSLIQYHTGVHSSDPFFLFNPIDVDARRFAYSVSSANQVRVDGKNLVGKTSDLLSYPLLEYLDIESMEDPKFGLKFQGFPPVSFSSGVLSTTIVVEALQAMPLAEYTVHVVITEDSLVTSTGHATKAVMRKMLPDNAGYRRNFAWGANQTDTIVVNWTYNTTVHPNASRLKVTTFVQDNNTKEVFQVTSSRDITIFYGQANGQDSTINVDQIEDQPGYEVVNMKLYPNPAKDLFNVEFEKELEGDYEWQLIDAIGRTLKTGVTEHGTTQMQVNTQDLSAGMYIFTIKNEHVYTQRKVIIRKY